MYITYIGKQYLENVNITLNRTQWLLLESNMTNNVLPASDDYCNPIILANTSLLAQFRSDVTA